MKPRVERLVQTETNYKHNGDKGSPGLFISGVPLTLEKSYFELELLNIGTAGEPVTGPVIGLCSYKYPLDLLPGTKIFKSFTFCMFRYENLVAGLSL